MKRLALSIIKSCPLLGGSSTKIVTFVTKYFVRYSRHVRYLGYPLLGGFTVQVISYFTVASLKCFFVTAVLLFPQYHSIFSISKYYASWKFITLDLGAILLVSIGFPLICLIFPENFTNLLLHKEWSFPVRISSANVTKSAVFWGFGHIYWRNPYWKTSFFVQWNVAKAKVIH